MAGGGVGSWSGAVASGAVGVAVAARRDVVRWLAVLGVVVVFAPLLQTSSALAAPSLTAEPSATGAADAGSALAAARSSGQPVEVLSRTSEWQRNLANPDGTFTFEQHAEAVRVRRADGSWMPVNTELRVVGGQVRPEAVVGEVRFSAGGSGPLAVIARDGRELSLALPWSLPAPVLDGPRATYRDVLPGVDLVLTARPEGFSEVLVVRTREAAANPALGTLRFAVAATGLSVRAENGGFVAVDATGATVFTSPAPLMWDSAGGAAREPVWPVEGDRVARMATTVGGGQVAVVPDRGLLEDLATVFPVYLDPSVTGSRNEWAMISSGFGGDDEYYKFAGEEGMGLCDKEVESTCNADQVKRLVWEFGIPAAVHRSHVLSATFAAYETHAYDCTADEVQLWWVGAISAATNWNNHAGTWYRRLASATVARKTGCPVGPGWVEFNATSIAADAAAGSWPTLTVGLKAGNEGSMPGGWKRFRNDATLSITYNSYPATPSALAVENKACGSSMLFVPSATPALRAHIFDPDGDTDLTVLYAWDRWNATSGVWERIGDLYKPGQASGSDPILRLGIDPGTGAALEHARRYRWTAALLDPYPGGQDASGWAPWCEFEVDTQNPAVAPGVSSPVYLEYIPGVQEDYYGGVGQTEPFTFTANGVSDVAGFKWGWADPPTTYVPAATIGGQVTLNITPPPPFPNFPTQAGTLTLRVRSVDRAGRQGPIRVYPMRVGMASDAVGAWDLAEPAGATTLLDTSGNAHNATPTNLTLGTLGRLLSGPAQVAPTAATFNGTTSAAATASPVLDTSQSFSVSAWARPDANSNGWRSVVSARGTYASAFFLRRDPNNRWTLTTVQNDSVTNAAQTDLPGTSTSRPGAWTHLVGVYDRGAQQMRLYVNGVLEATTGVPSVFKASGPLELGRDMWAGNSNFHPWWQGAIAEVRVWDRVLSGGEIAPLAATQVAAWSLDGHGFDDSGWGRDLTTSSVTWTADRTGATASAGQFNGTTSYAKTAGPTVDTSNSFTVAAWVRPDASNNGWRAILAATGSRHSSFFLRRDTNNQYHFTLVSDDNDSTTWTQVISPSYSTVGVWTHLVGVYDASAGKAYLYVNGVLVGNTAVPKVFKASGAFEIGRAWWAGSWTWHPNWHGAVDDVRVFAGAMPPSEIAKLYQP